MQKNKQRLLYIFFDAVTAIIAWTLFYIFRKEFIEHAEAWTFTSIYYIAISTVPFAWICLHYFVGYYKNVFRKSRSQELQQSFVAVFIGTTILFFVAVLDDYVIDYKQYYLLYAVLFALNFFLTLLPRLIITNIITRKIRKNILKFNTIIIGDNIERIEKYYLDIKKQKINYGFNIIGYVSFEEKNNISDIIPHLGNFDNIFEIISKYKIEDVIIAVETKNQDKIKAVFYKLQNTKVEINILPDIYDIIFGKVKLSMFLSIPLINVNKNIMPVWQEYLKIIFDFFASLFAIIILSPVYIILAILVKADSKGPAFFKQERIGKNGKPFNIIKFRTMVVDAEKNGPALSSKNNTRITKLGGFLRKVRLDEIPQFFNVLRGDMSLVGPRPEREFYIKQIQQKAPHYANMLSIRPGITSLGQVKYGYATNVNEMVERLRYDTFYLENRSLELDMKIMLLTVKVVFQRQGL